MPNRLQVNKHKIIYDFLSARDGEFCLACFAEKNIKHGPPGTKLQIDHADGNIRNWKPDNLHLLCQLHNLKFRQLSSREHKTIIHRYSAMCARLSVCDRGIEATAIAKAMVDYKNGSAEMQANSQFELQYREWALSEVKRLGTIPKKELINSGAEVVGCSPMSTTRYFAKLTSAIGPLQENRDRIGTLVINLRKA